MSAHGVKHELRMKYGLDYSEPTTDQAERWGKRTEALIGAGTGAEAAGTQAAKEIFQTFGTRKYAGQPDTIYDLLQELKKP